MQLTFLTDLGESYEIDIDSQMMLEDIMALLEAESGIPANEQSISFEERVLNGPSAKMADLVPDKALLKLRRKPTVAERITERESEAMRSQLLGNPGLMRQLRENNPERFAELLRQTDQRSMEAELRRQREIERLNADSFNMEAQHRIEENIRQEVVLENMAHALEYFPESFGRVTMLYMPVEVNGTPIKAFVDSGAQQTIMSPECAEQCGIMRLLDRNYAGVARGVGTAHILGRVHSAQLKLADLYLACAFTIMEGRDVDLLFGLDMLKAHQACIDLEKNVLRIRGREVKFLAEHELPDNARNVYGTVSVDEIASVTGADTNSVHHADSSIGSSRLATRTPVPQQNFPGTGQTLRSAPRSTPLTQQRTNSYPEASITTLTNLGITREHAIHLLDQTEGNVEYAASILFGN